MSKIRAREYMLRSGKRILLRTAETVDAQELHALVSAMIHNYEFALTAPEEYLVTIEQEVDWILANAQDEKKIIIVAEADGEVVGMINFRDHLRMRLSHVGEFGINVKKEWRDKGVGRALIEALLEWGRKHPEIEKISLEVFAHNKRAIHLYKALGFREEGRQILQVKMEDGTYTDLVLMARFVK